MDHNLSQFREIIEDCIEGEPVTHRQQTKLEAVLEMLPEEDTDHVKAYRSLMFLVEYLEDRDIDQPECFGNPDPVHQLYRLRGNIRDDAHEDILSRLKIEDDAMSTTIKDPVSKIHQRVTNEQKQHDMVEQQTEYLAREILEAPL